MSSRDADAVPLCSIVIPCYETPAPYLRECLQSVIEQSETSWEAIVVDDASTAVDVGDVVGQLNDPRIRTIRHGTNRGEAAARNTAVRAARAAHYAPLDADDRLDPEFLRKTKLEMERTPNASWILTDRRLFGASHDVLRYPDPLPLPCPVHFNAQSPGLIRRSLWDAIGGYCEERVFRDGGADLDFWLAAVERDAVAAHVPEPLYLWRMHRGSASQTTFTYQNHLIHEALLERHRALFARLTEGCARCRARAGVRSYLADGYFAAAEAALGRGERLRALRLSARGIMLERGRRGLRQLAKSMLPSRVRRVARTGDPPRVGPRSS